MVKTNNIYKTVKRNILIFLLLAAPTCCFGQIIGFAGQMTAKNKGQFATNITIPYIENTGGNCYFYIGSGAEYTTANAKISGLNLKPFSIFATTREMSKKGLGTAAIGLDTGYNFNLAHGNNGVIVTPHVYFDFMTFYMKAGYDYNTFHNEGQVFVRIGVGMGMGFAKLITNAFRF